DSGRGDPGRTDAVAAHDDRLLASRLVEIHRVERDGVLRPEFEDVADLNGFLDDERLAALDARLTGGDGVPVGGAAAEVSARADAAQVDGVAGRAYDVDADRVVHG